MTPLPRASASDAAAFPGASASDDAPPPRKRQRFRPSPAQAPAMTPLPRANASDDAPPLPLSLPQLSLVAGAVGGVGG